MECNVGKTDRVVRVVVAIVLLLAGYMYRESLGAWQWLLYIVAVILIVTILMSKCLPYKWIGINTCKTKALVSKSIHKTATKKKK